MLSENEKTRKEWLRSALNGIPAGARILDAGAGQQQFKEYCGHLKYVSQDVALYDGKGDESGLQRGEWDFGDLDIVSDITSIPEPDASFDAIMCVEVIEHLPDPLAALREFRRLLKTEGQLIITAPFCSLTHFAPYHYATGFNRYFYEKHLPENGFSIEELTPNGNFFQYLGQEINRLPMVMDRYSDHRMSRVKQFAMKTLLQLLQECDARDTGSSELLCFGYHVRAFKAS